MALPQSVVAELLDAFRTGDGAELIRESVGLVSQELIEAEATEPMAVRRGSSNETKHVSRTMAEDCAQQLDAVRLASSNAVGLATGHGQQTGRILMRSTDPRASTRTHVPPGQRCVLLGRKDADDPRLASSSSSAGVPRPRPWIPAVFLQVSVQWV